MYRLVNMQHNDNKEYIAKALNNLPTIYPLAVNVTLDTNSFIVTFPGQMGDVPLLTIISNSSNRRNVTEVTKGIPSSSYFALELDSAITQYLDFSNGSVTNQMLVDQFKQLFTIRCPPSLYDPTADSTIIYTNDFESDTSYDETFNVRDMAFCGRRAITVTNVEKILVTDNLDETVQHMCFAYKLSEGKSDITMYFRVESDRDFDSVITEIISIPLSLTSDNNWHYKCIELRPTIEQYFSSFSFATYLIVQDVFLDSDSQGAMFDTVTLRTARPNGYEDENQVSSRDQSATNACTFPFTYNEQSYSRCVLNDENLPICRSSTNQTYYCHSSSIEGVRRFYPKYQLLYNSLQIRHTPSNRTISIFFQYTTCRPPALINALPAIVGDSFSCD